VGGTVESSQDTSSAPIVKEDARSSSTVKTPDGAEEASGVSVPGYIQYTNGSEAVPRRAHSRCFLTLARGALVLARRAPPVDVRVGP